MTQTRTNTEITEDQQIEILRHEWLYLNGCFTYEAVEAEYEPGTINPAVFEAFLTDLTSGKRCLHCGGGITTSLGDRLCNDCRSDDQAREVQS